MSTVLCAYSGISYQCEHFPITLSSRETAHPIFYAPQKRLLSFLGKWAAAGLTPTDSYLLFLALLQSTEHVEFRVPAFRTPQTDSIIATNMEALAKVIIRFNSVSNPSIVFPRYVISPDTKSLSNVHHWIRNWNDSYDEFQSGNARELRRDKVQAKELALERLIKNPHNPVSFYAYKLAEWAALAGDFPSSLVPSPWVKGMNISLSDYWKDIICKCAREEKIYSIPSADLSELLEHCETSIQIGSIHSHTLFSVLRKATKQQHNLVTLGDIDITKTTYQILESSDSVESANFRAMIDSAPLSEPRQDQYPSKMAFMRAKLKWTMAKKLGSQSGTEDGGSNG